MKRTIHISTVRLYKDGTYEIPFHDFNLEGFTPFSDKLAKDLFYPWCTPAAFADPNKLVDKHVSIILTDDPQLLNNCFIDLPDVDVEDSHHTHFKSNVSAYPVNVKKVADILDTYRMEEQNLRDEQEREIEDAYVARKNSHDVKAFTEFSSLIKQLKDGLDRANFDATEFSLELSDIRAQIMLNKPGSNIDKELVIITLNEWEDMHL